jgi:hypothetical protein
MTGLAGVAGVIAVALCGYEISGTWGALLAALGLWLYPRYFGAMWNNPKDVPFAAAMTWILWATILLVKHWKSRRFLWYCALVGFCIGFAASIRVTAVIWYGILAVFLGSWVGYQWGAIQARNADSVIAHQASHGDYSCWPCFSAGDDSILAVYLYQSIHTSLSVRHDHEPLSLEWHCPF